MPYIGQRDPGPNDYPLDDFRVWPDGTVQPARETPYPWMSDDFEIVRATDEADALKKSANR